MSNMMSYYLVDVLFYLIDGVILFFSVHHQGSLKELKPECAPMVLLTWQQDSF